MFKLPFSNTSCLPKHESTIVLLYDKAINKLCIFWYFGPFKTMTLQLNHAKSCPDVTS